MAKAVTFGTIYGIGSKRLAAQLGTTSTQALQYKKQYFAGLKGSKEFFDQVVQKVTMQGQIKNKYGRIYKIPKNLGYKGVNYLVQGTTAPHKIKSILEKNSFNIPLYVDMEICDPSWATKKELTIKEKYDIINDIDWD